MSSPVFTSMASIKQNPATLPLPDFRNFGVMLRVLLGINAIALLAALVRSAELGEWLSRFVELAAWVQPLLLLDLAVLALLSPLLQRTSVVIGRVVVVTVAVVSAVLWVDFWRFMGIDEGGWSHLLRAALLAAALTGTMLFYFALRAKGFSPAVDEARLMALTARIRPHFLFNSLNAVLSLIRVDPRQAETALEELADLFRALLRDPRELVPLADEIALCRQYLDIEKLRLGERLQVDWNFDGVPIDLRIPPLMLQPLLENAVCHGIEPLDEGGSIAVNFHPGKDELAIEITNPCRACESTTRGNRMALSNIRERLALYYDLEARLETSSADTQEGHGQYRVRICLPRRSAGA